MTQHVLLVVTNTAVIGSRSRKAGFFFAEVAHPFEVLNKAGIAIEFASPAGGWTPHDAYDATDRAQKAFFESNAFRRRNRSRRLSGVDAADYDAILIAGGLGAMVDIQHNVEVQRAVLRAWTTGKFVTTVCYGACALLGVKLEDGTPFVRGKRLTSFSMAEAFDAARDDVLYDIEDALREEGAEYSAAPSGRARVIIDGRLITGQNLASAGPLAKELVSLLKSSR